MRDNRLLDHLNRSRSYKILKEFISVSFGLELSLLNPEGNLISSSLGFKPALPAIPPDDFLDAAVPVKCQVISESHLTDLQATRAAKIVECPRTGYRQILIPLNIKNNVVGIALCQQTAFMRLGGLQYNTILAFLDDFMQRLMNTEFEAAKNLLDKDLTHQQIIIKDVIAYIHSNYHLSSLSLKDVSVQKGISYHYLSHLFKKELKINFSAYLTKIRIEKAVKMLKNKSLSVSQVAYNCGFDDPGYFSKAFKLATGTSPTECRGQTVVIRTKKKRAWVTLPQKLDRLLQR